MGIFAPRPSTFRNWLGLPPAWPRAHSKGIAQHGGADLLSCAPCALVEFSQQECDGVRHELLMRIPSWEMVLASDISHEGMSPTHPRPLAIRRVLLLRLVGWRGVVGPQDQPGFLHPLSVARRRNAGSALRTLDW